MSELSRSTRALIEAGGSLGEPDEEVLRRMRSSVMRKTGIAAGGALALGATTVAGTAKAMVPTAKLVWLTLIAKVVGGAAVLGAVTFGVVASQSASHPTDAVPAAPARSAAARPHSVYTAHESSSPVPSVNAAAEEKAQLTMATPPPAPVAPSQAGRPSNRPTQHARIADEPAKEGAPSLRVSPAIAPEEDRGLADDLANLRDAQSALTAGHANDALIIAQRIRRGGPLDDEREGMQLLARCALSTDDASSRASAFVKSHPHATLATRLRSECGLDDSRTR